MRRIEREREREREGELLHGKINTGYKRDYFLNEYDAYYVT